MMNDEINILEVPVDEVGNLLLSTEIFVRVEGRKHRLYQGIDGRYYYYVHNYTAGHVLRALGAAE